MSSSQKTTFAVRHFLVALLLLACSLVHAQVIDRIDVTPGESEAEIVIRFSENIVYLRHAPRAEGKLVRIFVQLSDSSILESQLMQQSLRAPRTDRVPAASVIYPELVNGMLVTFPKITKYSIRPGSDNRSIVIRVPLLPATGPASAAPAVKKSPEVVKGAAAPAVAAVPGVVTPPEVPKEAVTKGAKEALPSPAPVVTVVAEPGAPSSEGGAEYVPTPAPAMSAAEVESRATDYLGEARSALAAKDLPTAINRLNRVLGLPVSSQTEAAQALIGEARELNGEILKARAEYDLYLKLFPNGPGVPRVKERLAALPKVEAVAAKPKALPTEAGPAEWTYNGSLSTYYYTGNSQIENQDQSRQGAPQPKLSTVDQNALITSLNVNARRRDAFTDTRIIVRDTDNRNYLRPDRSYNRLYSAYVDHTDRRVGYSVRLGRQNPTGMGVMERYDGIQGGYNLNPQWRVNAVYGDAIEFGSPFKKSFYGGSVDLLPQTGRPGVSVYAIEQTLDGFLNRRAVGSEVRYFDGRATAYGTLDYDVLYKGVNIAMLQGNYLDDIGNNYFFVLDHRRSPSYSLINALLGGGTSLRDQVALEGIDTVRQRSSQFTAVSNTLSVGVTHPLTERWQVGADYRVSSISSTQPVAATLEGFAVCPLPYVRSQADPFGTTCVLDVAASPGSGNSHTVTLQAIGSNLFVSNAVGVANLSLIDAPNFTGQSLALSYVLPLGEQWRLDTNLRYYTQRDTNGDSQDRLSPSLKLSYQWRNSIYLEGEAGYELANFTGTQASSSTREYMYMGARWDFR